MLFLAEARREASWEPAGPPIFFSHKRVVVRGFMFYLRGGYIDVYLDSYCRYVGTFLDSDDDDNGGNETTNIIIRIRRTHFQQL